MICLQKFFFFIYLLCFLFTPKKKVGGAPQPHPPARSLDTYTTFLNTVVCKGIRFQEQSVLDIKTHFKPTETFQYPHFSSVKKGFVRGEVLILLPTKYLKTAFEENITKFKSRLLNRGYPKNLIETLLSDIKCTERKSALQQKKISGK